MLQYLDSLTLCCLAPCYLPQLQRYVGKDDPVTSLVLKWIILVCKACSFLYGRGNDDDEVMRETFHALGVEWNRYTIHIRQSKLDVLIKQTLPIKSIRVSRTTENVRGTVVYDITTSELSLRHMISVMDGNAVDGMAVLGWRWWTVAEDEGKLVIWD